ncbi:choline/ethanolamine kinase family protein [Solibacillus cecembensis]|uniref:choline/ethanolamine kinase family protein n=1 Tax=Solibacillus cecembensis TaxID=459347 RepID=UPI003D05A5AC
MNQELIKEILETTNDVPQNLLVIKQMGGLTNQNFYVRTEDNEYVVRIAGENTSDYVDRVAEKYNSAIMTKKQIYLKDLFFDEATGNKLTEFIPNNNTFVEVSGEQRTNALSNIAMIFSALHSTTEKFHTEFDYFVEVDKYLAYCNDTKCSYFKNFDEVKDYIILTKEQYYSFQKNSTPCHIDPLGENFLITDNKVYLIDWEYSAMHDKYWDLAAFSLENMLTDEEEFLLLNQYLHHEVDTTIQYRINFYKIYQDFLWHLWGLYKTALGEDFHNYATERFNRCVGNIEKMKAFK